MISPKFLAIAIGLFFSLDLFAHDFEVLFPYSFGRDALEKQDGLGFNTELRTFLVDGEIESTGTESVTFDRTLNSHLRLVVYSPISDKLSARAVISTVASYRKVEGKEQPRTIKTESFYDLKPRLEMTFVTQSAVEMFFGLNYRIAGAFDSITESIDSTTTEKYQAARMDYPHFGFVKRAGGFVGGFYFQQGAEKARTVEKSNDRETTVLSLEDRIQDPTTIGIFAKNKISRYDVYTEFAAIQAGEGGNKTDDGGSVEEDYIRLTIGALIPASFIDIETTYIIKTLSYADSRNVSLKTIPQMGLHVDFLLSLGALDLKAGLVSGYGQDKQSIDEFNADYKVLTYGGTLGLKASF